MKAHGASVKSARRFRAFRKRAIDRTRQRKSRHGFEGGVAVHKVRTRFSLSGGLRYGSSISRSLAQKRGWAIKLPDAIARAITQESYNHAAYLLSVKSQVVLKTRREHRAVLNRCYTAGSASASIDET